MRALLENFCVYHVNAPGQEEGAPTLPDEWVATVCSETKIKEERDEQVIISNSEDYVNYKNGTKIWYENFTQETEIVTEPNNKLNCNW
jgi:hypothetical protein